MPRHYLPPCYIFREQKKREYNTRVDSLWLYSFWHNALPRIISFVIRPSHQQLCCACAKEKKYKPRKKKHEPFFLKKKVTVLHPPINFTLLPILYSPAFKKIDTWVLYSTILLFFNVATHFFFITSMFNYDLLSLSWLSWKWYWTDL